MLQLPIYQAPQSAGPSFSGLLDAVFGLSPYIFWLVMALPVLFFALMSFVFSYHWKRFGMDILVMARVSLIYYTVSVTLLMIMAISLTVYIKSI